MARLTRVAVLTLISRELLVDIFISGFHFSSKRIEELSQYISEDFTYFSTTHVLATVDRIGCLQIIEKDRAGVGPPNLEGTAFYQGLELFGFHTFSRCFKSCMIYNYSRKISSN